MAEDDIAFLNLILMVGTMASQRIESLKTAGPAERSELIPKAREAILMLNGLKQRTTGRLSVEEDTVLGTMLKDLQARYVKALGFRPGSAPPPR